MERKLVQQNVGGMAAGGMRVGGEPDDPGPVGKDDLQLFVFGIAFLKDAFQLDNGKPDRTSRP